MAVIRASWWSASGEREDPTLGTPITCSAGVSVDTLSCDGGPFNSKSTATALSAAEPLRVSTSSSRKGDGKGEYDEDAAGD